MKAEGLTFAPRFSEEGHPIPELGSQPGTRTCSCLVVTSSRVMPVAGDSRSDVWLLTLTTGDVLYWCNISFTYARIGWRTSISRDPILLCKCKSCHSKNQFDMCYRWICQTEVFKHYMVHVPSSSPHRMIFRVMNQPKFMVRSFFFTIINFCTWVKTSISFKPTFFIVFQVHYMNYIIGI